MQRNVCVCANRCRKTIRFSGADYSTLAAFSDKVRVSIGFVAILFVVFHLFYSVYFHDCLRNCRPR